MCIILKYTIYVIGICQITQFKYVKYYINNNKKVVLTFEVNQIYRRWLITFVLDHMQVLSVNVEIHDEMSAKRKLRKKIVIISLH